VNVLANPHFGTVVAESGLAYTWSENAHEFRLTPWSDDSVGASGARRSTCATRRAGISGRRRRYRRAAPCLSCRHGFGYSVFEHTSGGIRSELWVYVDLEDAVKFSVLKVRNGSGRTRRLSATGYVEWVLVTCGRNSRRTWSPDRSGQRGLVRAQRLQQRVHRAGRVLRRRRHSRTLSGDRTEFLGRNGSLARPDAMTRSQLSGRLGAGLDPCGAIQVPFELADGQEREIIFRLGTGRTLLQARELAQRLRRPGSARAALEKLQQYWKHTLGTVRISTPDPALDVLCNGWLLYRPSPAGCGRAVACTSRAVPGASATSCRT